ncbi:MAG TPA: polysaccharide biosynthesis/export family protein [Coleofasciculaceae cyanobacterium]
MLNRISFSVIPLSVSGAMIGVMALQSPIFAQLPTLEASQSVLTHEQTDWVNPAYVLGPGDEISINVLGYEEFKDMTYVVMPDGTITMPLIGRVPAANLTIPELNQELTSRLKSWLTNPVIITNLTRLRPLRVNVSGEVQRPGPVQLSSVSNATLNSGAGLNPSSATNPNAIATVTNQIPTVTVALLSAGGVTREADIRQVVLKRARANGESSTITLNLWESLLSENAPRDLILQDGGSIFVPRLQAGESIDRRLASRASFAPRTVRVRVVGEVKIPGEVQVPPDGSLSSAVAIAGGPTDKAKLKNVRFIRMQEDGTLQEQVVDLSSLNDTYQVQDGDVIFVPKSDRSSFLDVARDAVNPFNILFNLYRVFTGNF